MIKLSNMSCLQTYSTHGTHDNLVTFVVACILMIVSAVWSWTKHVDSGCSGATPITNWAPGSTEASCTGLCEADPACQGFTLSHHGHCRLYDTCDTISHWNLHNSYNGRIEPTTQAPGVPVTTKFSTNVPEATAKIAVTTSQVRTTREETTTEPHEITTEAHKITTKVHEATTEALEFTTETHEITTAAHEITTEANKVTTEAHEIITQAQERSTMREDSTTEAQGSTTIKEESATELSNASTVKDDSSTETHKTTLNVPDYIKELTIATTESQKSSTNFQEITTVAEVYTEVEETTAEVATGEKMTTQDSRDVTNQINPLAEWADRVMQVGEYCGKYMDT